MEEVEAYPVHRKKDAYGYREAVRVSEKIYHD